MSLIILMAFPVAIAPMVVLLQRRQMLAASLSAASASLWTLLCLATPPGTALEVLGRPLVLSRLDRLALVYLGLQAVLLILAERLGGEVVFTLSVLPMLGIATAALMVSHLGIAAVLVALTAMVAVFAMAGYHRDAMAVDNHNTVQPASGYLSLMVIAALLLMAAAWFNDLMAVEANTSAEIRPIVILLVTALGILSAVPPFHGWWIITVKHSPPALAAFLGTILPTMAMLLLAGLLQTHLWTAAGNGLARALIGAGLLAGAVGGSLAASADNLQRWQAYAATAEIGGMLAGLGTMTLTGAVGAAFLLVNHGLSLTLTTACRITWPMRRKDSDSQRESEKPWGRLSSLPGQTGKSAPHSPFQTGSQWAMLGWTISGLSLSGAPLTAGFVGRWFVYRSMSQQSILFTAILVLSSFGVLIGHLRTWHSMTGQPYLSERGETPTSLRALIAALTVIMLVLGVAPDLILQSIVEALRSLAFSSP